MTIYTIKGNPNRPLTGHIKCCASKNTISKVLMCCLLTDEISTLSNIPSVGDLDQTIELLTSLNVACHQQENSLNINPYNLKPYSDLVFANRLSISLLAVLAHRFKNIQLPLLTGCDLGARGIDLHLDIYEQFGLKVELEHSKISLQHSHEHLNAQHITLPYPSVGATDTAILLSVLAKGTSVLENIALEPEVLETITFLQLMGAQISWQNRNTLVITGVDKLKGANFSIIPERLEPVTWSALSALSNGSIIVENVRLDHMQTFLGYFNQIGGGFEFLNHNTVRFYKATEFNTIKICANNYPNLATDQLAQLSTMLIKAGGSIHDTVYEKRIEDVHQMFESFGVQSTLSKDCVGKACRFERRYNHSLHIQPSSLKNPDKILTLPKNIRCAHSYLILASQTPGTTILHDVSDSIHRGYNRESLVDKLRATGVDIYFETQASAAHAQSNE